MIKKILIVMVVVCAIWNLSVLRDDSVSVWDVTVENVEALGENETAEGGYTQCIVGTKTSNSNVSQVTWCGDCKSARVVRKGDGRCKIG